jgi:opacity protein-like surface antigen
MKFTLAIALSVLAFSSFAQASSLSMGSKVIEGKEGSPAAIKWNEVLAKGEIVSDEKSEESSADSTTIALGKTTCTMKDGSFYRCETLN